MKDQPLLISIKQHAIAVPLYGILSAIWKVVIWIGIMTILSLLAKGAGTDVPQQRLGVWIYETGWSYIRKRFEEAESGGEHRCFFRPAHC